jgi:undecaprenyl-diphosphatase
MVGGLVRGLDNEDAARFSFLLATPIILLAGIYKLPDLIGVNGNGVRGQTLVGSLAAGIAAYLTVRFLDKYFKNNNLMPFAVYCILFGLFMVIKLR